MHAKYLVHGRFSINIILFSPFTKLASSSQSGSKSRYWHESSILLLAKKFPVGIYFCTHFMDYNLSGDYSDPIKYCEAGVLINGVKEPLDINNITESIEHTWAQSSEPKLKPGISAPPTPDAYKIDGYSWVNSPRYKNFAMEGGPLARMIMNGYYNHGVSAMDRLVARVLEIKKICESIEGLIDLLKVGEPYQKPWETREKAKGIGLTAASRGALSHFISIENGKVANFTLITPSAWNLSPTDGAGVRGPVEQALIGTEVNNMKNPVEIGRIVRSFDPCLNCAAHVTSDRYAPMTINIV